jgi:hypothetical protein
MKRTFKCLFKDTPLWRIFMSKHLRKPKEQDDHVEGTLRDEPRLMHVTPTVLLGSWIPQPIEDHMTSLGTDFETHANWQGCVEVPAAKDFVVRKVHTIALRKVQGTHWNAIKHQEHL